MKENKTLRYKLYELVDFVDLTGDGENNFDYYDFFMLFIILLSLVPLLFKEETPFLILIDAITVTIFIIDYILRLITADYRASEGGAVSFLKYPFTPMAIFDLLAIVPSLTSIFTGFNSLRLFKLLKTFRLVRTLKVFRITKTARYSKSVAIIAEVFKESKEALIAVCSFAIAYIFISALVVFNVEPESFNDFFEAMYWATISLTTVGYGDIYPVTEIGRFVAMASSIFGIAIVALPAGIITAGYMEALRKKVDHGNENIQNNENDHLK